MSSSLLPSRFGALVAVISAGLSFYAPEAHAVQDLEDEAAPEAAEKEGEAEGEAQGDEGESAATESSASDGATSASVGSSLAAGSWDRNAMQFEVGARGRLMVVPKFLINAFQVQGATDLVVGGIGAEGGISQGSFEGLLGVWYAGYGTDRVPFKAPNDPDTGWEMIKSNLGLLYITADLMFRGKIAEDWQWFVGAGLGVGIVTGSLQRNETYWAPGGGTDPYTQLQLCPVPVGVGTLECPGPINNDNRYDLTSTPNQTSSAWSIYPWVTYQMGVRYQPIKNFIGRLDLGVGSSGFWLGLGADYGI